MVSTFVTVYVVGVVALAATINAAVVVKVSVPAPPSTLSVVAKPAVNVIESVPAPPDMLSEPVLVVTVSVSLPELPVIVLAEVPAIVAVTPMPLVGARADASTFVIKAELVTNVPKVRPAVPVTFNLVALSNTGTPRTLVEDPALFKVSVSMPAAVKTAEPVTFCNFMVAASLVPVVLAKVTVWANAVSCTVGAKVRPMPWRVVVFVAPWLVRVVMPVELDRSITLAAAVLVIDTFSIFLSTVGVTEPFTTAKSSSLPAPPSKLSPEFRVCRLEVVNPPSKVSSPEVPVKLFVPAVREKVLPETAVLIEPKVPPELSVVCDMANEESTFVLKAVAAAPYVASADI